MIKVIRRAHPRLSMLVIRRSDKASGTACSPGVAGKSIKNLKFL